jgi:dolichol-phosphate mannosyltransferase
MERLAATLPVRVLNEPVRGDLARAWRRGIEAATYPAIVTMDADLCHTPAFVPQLLDALDTADMVIASRYLTGGRRMPSKRLRLELISQLGQRLCRVALRLPQADISHGFRAFRREVYDRLRDTVTTPGNAFMMAFTYHAHRAGFPIREIPYTYGARLHGEEHLNVMVESPRFLAFILSEWKRRRGKQVASSEYPVASERQKL